MKRSQLKVLLLAEGAVCALLALALRLIEGDAFSVAGFPGGAIGQGLSALAVSGRLGFALALTLYAFCVLLPLYVLARIGERRKLKSEDALLALIAVAVACALFPRGWVAYWSTSAETLFPRLAWQWLILALLAGWVVLRLLRRFSDGGTRELLCLFRTLLALAAAYFAIGLLDTMENGAFTQESAAYAPKLAEWCVKVLKLSVLFALAVNLVQAVCAPMLLNTSISIRLPIFELCFVLAALLGARLIASNVALAADNDLFI